jgi:group I intron endonuclease
MSTFQVAIYMDPLKQKGDIFKENNKKSGIYRWTMKLSGKTYVGSAIDLTRRFISYFSLAHFFYKKKRKKVLILRNGNSVICSSLLKYGYSYFSLEILEYSYPIDIITREQYYLYNLKPEYNILTFARSSKGFKHSQKTKRLLSLLGLNSIRSDYTKLKISIKNSRSKTVVITNIE